MIGVEIFGAVIAFFAIAFGFEFASRSLEKRERKRNEALNAIRLLFSSSSKTPKKIEELLVFHGDSLTKRERNYFLSEQCQIIIDNDNEREMRK